MKTNKELYIDLLNESKPNEKETNEKFIKYLDENGFFEAPASTKYHLNVEGGLLQHTLNVVQNIIDLQLMPVFLKHCNLKDAIFCGLVHDVGKIGWNNKPNYLPKFNKNGTRSAVPYERNKSCLQLEHEELSLLHVIKFYNLSDDEIFAIKNHNGAYGYNERNISGKETPLMLLVHFADMIAARINEDEKYNVKVKNHFGG